VTESVATILILDEETDSCMLLKRLLERNAHQVWAFVNANDALECAAVKSLDLALVNLASRHDTGLAVPAALKRANPGLKVMVIADSVHEEGTQAVSADGFLVKPVDIDSVERKVRELLQKQSPDLGSDAVENCNVTGSYSK
jgi:response regulator RpfG family c-di-GMP phosphodiesterase